MSDSFRWWPKEAVDALRDQLNANPEAILKQYAGTPNYLHLHPLKEGTNDLVAPEDCPPPINDSRLCPVLCP